MHKHLIVIFFSGLIFLGGVFVTPSLGQEPNGSTVGTEASMGHKQPEANNEVKTSGTINDLWNSLLSMPIPYFFILVLVILAFLYYPPNYLKSAVLNWSSRGRDGLEGGPLEESSKEDDFKVSKKKEEEPVITEESLALSTNTVEEEEIDDNDVDSNLHKAFLAKDQRDVEGFKKYFDLHLNENSVDDSEKHFLLSFKYRVLFELGEHSSLEELKKLEGENDSVYDYPLAIGACYRNMDSLDKAVEYYKKAINRATNEKDILHSIVSLVNVYFKIKDTDDLINYLFTDGVCNQQFLTLSDQGQSEVYERIADLYKKLNNKLYAYFYLFKSLKKNPVNLDARFTLNYELSNDKEIRSSLYGYGLNIQNGASPVNVNNYGVALGSLGMPGKSFEAFEKSWERGDGRAASNLLSKFVNAGMFSLADKLIEEFEEKNIKDERYDSVLNDYKEMKKKESDLISVELDKGRESLQALESFFLDLNLNKSEANFNLKGLKERDSLYGLSGDGQEYCISSIDEDEKNVFITKAPNGEVGEIKWKREADKKADGLLGSMLGFRSGDGWMIENESKVSLILKGFRNDKEWELLIFEKESSNSNQ